MLTVDFERRPREVEDRRPVRDGARGMVRRFCQSLPEPGCSSRCRSSISFLILGMLSRVTCFISCFRSRSRPGTAGFLVFCLTSSSSISVWIVVPVTSSPPREPERLMGGSGYDTICGLKEQSWTSVDFLSSLWTFSLYYRDWSQIFCLSYIDSLW